MPPETAQDRADASRDRARPRKRARPRRCLPRPRKTAQMPPDTAQDRADASRHRAIPRKTAQMPPETAQDCADASRDRTRPRKLTHLVWLWLVPEGGASSQRGATNTPTPPRPEPCSQRTAPASLMPMEHSHSKPQHEPMCAKMLEELGKLQNTTRDLNTGQPAQHRQGTIKNKGGLQRQPIAALLSSENHRKRKLIQPHLCMLTLRKSYHPHPDVTNFFGRYSSKCDRGSDCGPFRPPPLPTNSRKNAEIWHFEATQRATLAPCEPPNHSCFVHTY